MLPSSQPSQRNSFESSLHDGDMHFGYQSDTEKLWEDIQSLVQMNFENLEEKLLHITQRMEQMEQNLMSLKTQVDEQLSESPSSSDSSRASEPLQKRKRKTPLTLQVQLK